MKGGRRKAVEKENWKKFLSERLRRRWCPLGNVEIKCREEIWSTDCVEIKANITLLPVKR